MFFHTIVFPWQKKSRTNPSVLVRHLNEVAEKGTPFRQMNGNDPIAIARAKLNKMGFIGGSDAYF